MDPKQPLSPQQIISLLARLQPTSKGYPYKLMAARRSAFLQQAAGLSLGAHGLSGKAFRIIHSATHPAAQIAAQWSLGILAAALAVTAVILARNVYLDRITPDDTGTVLSETASLPSESSPTEILTTFTSTAVPPTTTDLPPALTDYTYATLTHTPSKTATPATYTPVDPNPTDDNLPTITKTPRPTNTSHPTTSPRPTYPPRPTNPPNPTKTPKN